MRDKEKPRRRPGRGTGQDRAGNVLSLLYPIRPVCQPNSTPPPLAALRRAIITNALQSAAESYNAGDDRDADWSLRRSLWETAEVLE